MTEVIILQSPSTQLSSSPSSIPISDNDGLHQQTHESSLIKIPTSYSVPGYTVEKEEEEEEEEGVFRERKRRREREEGDQLSLLGVWFTEFRKSLIACRSSERVIDSMEIGVPTNVRHVAHVTFDRFNGFLGLPVEFEPEVPRRPPSASTSVFGVSTESMQLSFDSRGNSVPTILLMMQRRLYVQGGLQAEGIFRINGENGQEEHIREQLNIGLIPDNVDVHCLAGLIKAWFRELPNGVLDSLSPEQVIQAQSEQECVQLVRHLPSTEAALLDWAINLMADIAQLENFNKMNARNVAMVFAPNMTQMADPMTALMYAVQVMNFLKTLIVKTLRDREDSKVETGHASHLEPSDENGRNSSSQPISEEVNEMNEEEQVFVAKVLLSESHAHSYWGHSKPENDTHNNLIGNFVRAGKGHLNDTCPDEVSNHVGIMADGQEEGNSNKSTGGAQLNMCKTRYGQSSKSVKKGSRKCNERPMARVAGQKSRGTTIVSRLNSRTERVEAWR